MDIKGKNLLVFGDSIMYGSGNNGFGVGEYLARDCGAEVKKYCVGGARVGFYEGKNWMVEQVRRAVNERAQADVIVFNGFTNDCHTDESGNCDVSLGEVSDGLEVADIFALGRGDADFSRCFESILSAFKTYFANAKLLFVRPHRMGKRGEAEQVKYGERAKELCRKWGIAVCDLYTDSGLDTFIAEHRDKYTNDSYGTGHGDCTHPNSSGYEKFYMPLIEKAICEL